MSAPGTELGAQPGRRFGARGLLVAAALLLTLGGFLEAPWRARLLASERRLEVLAVDVSESLLASRPQALGALRRSLVVELEALDRRGAEVELWAFAAQPRRLFAAGEPERLRQALLGQAGQPPLLLAPLDLEPTGSDLGLLLEALRSSLQQAGRRSLPERLVLYSDGLFAGPGPPAREALAAWLRAGLSVEQVEPLQPERASLRLRRASWPPEIAPGDGFEVELDYEVGGLDLGELALLAGFSSSDGRRLESGGNALPGSVGRHRERVLLEPPLEPPFELDLGLSAGDVAQVAWLGARQVGLVRAEGRRLVALVAEGPSNARAALGPTPPGLDIEPVAAAELPARLSEFDAVLWWDLGLAGLPVELESYVAAGGGLMTLGGTSQLIPADLQSALSGLPLIAPPLPRPPREVVLLFDASGSMAGAPMQALEQAALDLAAVLPEQDALVLRWFTEALSRPLRLPGGDRRAAAKELLGLTPAHGGTALFYSLGQYTQEREREVREGARPPQLIVLLTDGRDGSPPEFPERVAGDLRARLAATGAALHVVALGPSADLELLAPLAGGPAQLLESPSPQDLSRLVFQLGAGERLIRGPFTPEVSGSEFLALDSSRAPPPGIELAVRGIARPGAEVFWRAPTGEPLGALQRSGLGRVVSLAFAPGRECAPLWSAGPWLRAPLKWIADRPAEVEIRLTLTADRIELEGGLATWPASLSARLQPRGEAAGLPAAALVLDASGPGRWNGHLPARFRAGDRDVPLELLLDLPAGESSPGLPWIGPRPPWEPLSGEPLTLAPIDPPAFPGPVLDPPPFGIPAEPRANPWAASILALGALLLFLGAGLSLRPQSAGDQGAPSADR